MSSYPQVILLCVCVLVITSGSAIAECVKVDISSSPFIANTEADKSLMEKDFKNIEFVAEARKHQSVSDEFLNLGIRIHNESSEDILISELQEYCQAIILDPVGNPLNLPQKAPKALINRSGPEGKDLAEEWVTVPAKSEKIVSLFIKNPSIILGKEKILRGTYKIRFFCVINAKKAGDTEIRRVSQKSDEVEFDFASNDK
jgi:hypothetical protein